jgi:hypothetical protein
LVVNVQHTFDLFDVDKLGTELSNNAPYWIHLIQICKSWLTLKGIVRKCTAYVWPVWYWQARYSAKQQCPILDSPDPDLKNMDIFFNYQPLQSSNQQYPLSLDHLLTYLNSANHILGLPGQHWSPVGLADKITRWSALIMCRIQGAPNLFSKSADFMPRGSPGAYGRRPCCHLSRCHVTMSWSLVMRYTPHWDLCFQTFPVVSRSFQKLLLNWLTKVATCFQLLERCHHCSSLCTATNMVSTPDSRYASWLSFEPLLKFIASYLRKLHLNLWGYHTWPLLSVTCWKHKLLHCAIFWALHDI